MAHYTGGALRYTGFSFVSSITLHYYSIMTILDNILYHNSSDFRWSIFQIK